MNVRYTAEVQRPVQIAQTYMLYKKKRVKQDKAKHILVPQTPIDNMSCVNP